MSSPSLFHQVLVELMRSTPDELLLVGQSTSGEPSDWSIAPGDLSSSRPAELLADLVLRRGPEAAPNHVVIVEVQLQWDNDKAWRWPHYLIAARDRYRCEVSLLVLTPNRHVAKMCAQPIHLGHGTHWRPLVLGPERAMEFLRAADTRELSPQTRALLVLLAGRSGGAALAHDAFEVIRGLDTNLPTHYLELLFRILPADGRVLLRSLLMDPTTEYTVWKHKNPISRALLKEGLEEGLEKGARSELLALVAPVCDDAELAQLRELPDLVTLRQAVHRRLGLPVVDEATEG